MELEPGWKKYCVSYPLTIYPCWWLLVHSGHEDSELIANEVRWVSGMCSVDGEEFPLSKSYGFHQNLTLKICHQVESGFGSWQSSELQDMSLLLLSMSQLLGYSCLFSFLGFTPAAEVSESQGKSLPNFFKLVVWKTYKVQLIH